MLGARVDHQEFEADRPQVEGNLTCRHVPAIEGQRVPLATTQRRRLIQATRVSARDLILRCLSGLDQHLAALVVRILKRTRQPQATDLVQGHGRRTFERRARREATTQGHARPQGSIEAGKRAISDLLEGPRDASEVRGPVVGHLAGGPLRTDHVKVEDVDRLARLRRHQANRAITAGRQRHKRTVRQSNGQAGAAVIVHVLADDIDAPGRAPHAPRLIAKRFTEERSSLLGTFLRGGSIGPHESAHKILLGLTHPKAT